MECSICSKSPTFNLNSYHDMYDLSSTVCKVLEIPNFAGYFNSSTLCFTCLQKTEQAQRMFKDMDEIKLRLSKIKDEFEEDLKSRSFNFNINKQNGPHVKIENSSTTNNSMDTDDDDSVQEDLRTSSNSNDDMGQQDYSIFSLIDVDQANSSTFNQNRAEAEINDSGYSSTQSLSTINLNHGHDGNVIDLEGYPDLIIVQNQDKKVANFNYGPKSSRDICKKEKKKGHPKTKADAGRIIVRENPQCEEMPDELKSHNEMVHNKSKSKKVRYSCPEQDCGDTFATNFSLHRHIEKMHGKKFKCNIGACKKRFSDLNSFNEHTAYHQKDNKPRPFICTICSTPFSSNNHLLRHQNSHSNTPHRCPHPDCGANFVYPQRLQLHIQDKHSSSS